MRFRKRWTIGLKRSRAAAVRLSVGECQARGSDLGVALGVGFAGPLLGELDALGVTFWCGSFFAARGDDTLKRARREDWQP